MYTDHGLQVHLRIPVRVINNDHVSCSQVNPQPTSPSAQHKEKLGAVGLIKNIDGDLRRLRENNRTQNHSLESQHYIVSLVI